MQFIRLPKLIDIADQELPELVANWINMRSVQHISNSFVQTLGVHMLICWVFQCSTSWMPHQHTYRYFTHWVWVIWDLSNHNVFWIIPDPRSQTRLTLSPESISTIAFQVGTSCVMTQQCGQHCSHCGMPCLAPIFSTSRATQNQPNQDTGELSSSTADIFPIVPIVRYSGQAGRSPERLVKWVWTHALMMVTIVAPAGSWSCIFQHQLPVFKSLYILRLSKSACRTSSTSWFLWNGRCTHRNCTQLTISL